MAGARRNHVSRLRRGRGRVIICCAHLLRVGYGSIPIDTIFSGMNIHLPAILGFTRYQGFDPSPVQESFGGANVSAEVFHYVSLFHLPPLDPNLQHSLTLTTGFLKSLSPPRQRLRRCCYQGSIDWQHGRLAERLQASLNCTISSIVCPFRILPAWAGSSKNPRCCKAPSSCF